jgi:Flp pilus assembly pilin Flp
MPQVKRDAVMTNERPAMLPEQNASQPAQPVDGRAAGKQDATAVKYALIASGIGAAVAATVYSLSTSAATLYQSVASFF